jgi:uncharacterized protein (DUF1800 family)
MKKYPGKSTVFLIALFIGTVIQTTQVFAQTLSTEEIDVDVIRFLAQSTFGATPDTYTELRSKISQDGSNRLSVYEDWIDEQISQPLTDIDVFCDTVINTITTETRRSALRDVPDCYWTTFTFGKDQLRQRVAFALSQILVISTKKIAIQRAHRGVFRYWNTLSNHAFGSYSDLLYDVSIDPVMGAWLSHIQNPKPIPELGIYPDENYAREIMQLFSIGLVHRNLDGAVILDDENNPIPTYNNSIVQELARVFTGLSFSRWYNSEKDGIDNTLFKRQIRNVFGNGQHQWLEPMKVFSDQHDYDEKTLFTDNEITLIIPAATEHTEESALSEIRTVTNALTAHSSTAPYISRLLIQRLVTSNPSPEYIERVASTFSVEGDMTAVIKAILLDPQARDPAQIDSDRFGKVKEPVLLLTNLFRLLDAYSGIYLDNREVGIDTPNHDNFDPGATLLRVGNLSNTGQEIMAAPSVFSYFSPDFSPRGVLSDEGIVTPESQLKTENQLINTFNIYHRYSIQGIHRFFNQQERNAFIPPFTLAQHETYWNTEILESIWEYTQGDNRSKSEALVDFMDFYLNAGYLSSHYSNNVTREAIVTNVASSNETNRYRSLISGIANAPETQIQK